MEQGEPSGSGDRNTADHATSGSTSHVLKSNANDLSYEVYCGEERDLQAIMDLVDQELSEP